MLDVNQEKATQHKILCCECGILIEPNTSNTCAACIRTRIDITEGILKQNNIQWCKGCNRFMNQNNKYIRCSLESKELLAICLKKLKGLNKVKLIDASFIWTEPHSKRIKIKLIIQKEIFGGAILQQSMSIEYIVMNQMCDDCHKREAKDFWKAVVQIRQKIDNKRTFYYLEQLMLKHKFTSKIINIKPEHGGLDFYFSSKDDARQFSDFIQKIIPCRLKYSQRLISHDVHNNSYNYKSTFSIEIIPVVKDSIVCFSNKLAHILGFPGKNRIGICYKLSRSAHFIDPISMHTFEITSNMYANSNIGVTSNSGNSDSQGLEVLCTIDKMNRFIVMDIDKVVQGSRHNNNKYSNCQNGPEYLNASTSSLNSERIHGIQAREEKFGLGECWVTRDSDQSKFNDVTLFCFTHLGNILKPGDLVLGFHMPTCNLNNKYLEQMKETDIPEVILVKKIYEDECKKTRNDKRTNATNKRKFNQNDSDSMICGDSQGEEVNSDEDNEKVNTDDILVEIGEDDELYNNTPKLSLQEMLEDFHMD